MSTSLNVLMIEDNPDDVLLMQEMLKETNIECSIIVLEDGEAALHYLRRIEFIAVHERPSLVVLDLNLPKKNGHEVLSELCKLPNLQNLPVVVLSTSEDPEDRRKALESNATYVVKPARSGNLAEFIAGVEFTYRQDESEPFAMETSLESELESCEESSSKNSKINIDVAKARELFSTGSSLKVLLVEDNPHDVLLIETFLNESRLATYETTSVEDMGTALDFLASNKVDVILADMGLPDAYGLEVLSRLLTYANAIPIVILTGLDDEIIAMEAVSKGAQDYLVKGQVSSESLGRSIRYAVTRKRAEELALRTISAEKEVLQEILQHAPIGIARFTSDLRISECNSVFVDQIQMPYDRIISRAVPELIEGTTLEQWEEVVSQGKPFRTERRVINERSPEHNLVWDVTVWPIKTRFGDTRGGIILALDITMRVKLEQQREDFIASVAHDIKSPLVGADRILNILTSPTLSDEEHDKLVSLLRDSNSTVLTMLHNLLDIYRYEASAVFLLFEPIDITEPIEAAISLTSLSAINKKISIVMEFPKSLSTIRGDHVSIQRLFSNLLLNAFQYSKQGGTVKISCRDSDDGVVVEVIDRGKGMTAEELGFIFKRFGESPVSKYRGGTGSGLGLYLCKQIVDSHQGSIVCNSDVGLGSTFTVRLPRI